ncbi:MAG: hypothetical protein DWQ07_11845 [Chloroflexi bacterium]|nr:MAG: hypothetical protein DWQ07_11845 [Chloroflexota bacterium]MBL1197462.1 hypothetical protein [Chloroflexota bacterium]NOH14757.1 hypothetical protein [Chloroflexota bacterium]
MLSKQAEQRRKKEKVLAYINQQLGAGVDKKDIVDDLEARGMKRNVAIDLVMDFEYQEQLEAVREVQEKKATSSDGTRKMVIGCGLFLAGSVVTAVTWAIAGPGGQYIVCYGAIAWGAIYALAGLFQVLTSS